LEKFQVSRIFKTGVTPMSKFVVLPTLSRYRANVWCGLEQTFLAFHKCKNIHQKQEMWTTHYQRVANPISSLYMRENAQPNRSFDTAKQKGAVVFPTWYIILHTILALFQLLARECLFSQCPEVTTTVQEFLVYWEQQHLGTVSFVLLSLHQMLMISTTAAFFHAYFLQPK